MKYQTRRVGQVVLDQGSGWIYNMPCASLKKKVVMKVFTLICFECVIECMFTGFTGNGMIVTFE